MFFISCTQVYALLFCVQHYCRLIGNITNMIQKSPHSVEFYQEEETKKKKK